MHNIQLIGRFPDLLHCFVGKCKPHTSVSVVWFCIFSAGGCSTSCSSVNCFLRPAHSCISPLVKKERKKVNYINCAVEIMWFELNDLRAE